MTKGQSLFFAILAAGYLIIGFSLAARGVGSLFRKGRRAFTAATAPLASARKWNRSWIGPWREKSLVGMACVAKTQPNIPTATALRLLETANEKRSLGSIPETRTPDASADPLPQRVA